MSSYQVFARKYRPQTFDEVVGQEHITQTLRNAVAANRLAHAYLFVGPRGTGKTSTARILAKALNCIHGPTVNPCGVCDVCREIAAGNSLDVLEIDGASNNGVDQVRELRENVRFAPTRGKYKVYIIDEVHMLTSAAFNALLKTLEEPPEHVKFIFATTDVQKVLPTILSRCQRFDLRRIPAAMISDHLQFIAGKEGIKLDVSAAHSIAKGAEGGLRDAESMLDQLVAFCGEQITEQDVLSVFGFTSGQTVSALCDHLLDGNAPAALSVVHEQAEAGRDLMRLMADLIGHFRNLLVAKADPTGIEDEVGGELMNVLEEQSGRIAMDRLLDLIEQFAAAEGRMKWAPNKKLHFEIAVIKAIQTLNQATLTEVLDTLTAIRTGGEVPASIQRTPVERPVRDVAPRAAAPAPAPKREYAVPAPTPSPAPVAKAVPIAAPVPVAAPAPVPEVKAEPALVAPEPTPFAETPARVEVPPTQEVPAVASSPAASSESALSLETSAPEVKVAEPEKPRKETKKPAAKAAPVEDLFGGFSEPERSVMAEEPGLFAEIPKPVAAEPEPAVMPSPSAPEATTVAADRADLAPWESSTPVAKATPTVADFAPEPEAEEEHHPEPVQVEAEAPASSGDVGADLWYRAVSVIREKKPLLSKSVEAGVFLELVNNTFIIGFPKEEGFAMNSLEKASNRAVLVETLATLAGQPVNVRFEIRAGLELQSPRAASPVEPPADPMEEFKNDPSIRKALELFEAEIKL